MPFTRSGASAHGTNSSSAAAVQTAFRDVTNNYLSANKENIPPGICGGWLGGGGGGGGCASGSGSHNACRRGRGLPLRDAAVCGTPVQPELARADTRHDAADCMTDEQRLHVALFPGTPVSGGALLAQTPVRCAPSDGAAAATGTAAAAMTAMDDSAVVTVPRTPGHDIGTHHSVLGSTGKSALLRQRGQQGSDTSTATPNQYRQRPCRVVRAAMLAPPLYTGGAESCDHRNGAQVTSPPSLFCTPNGARRSTTAAAAAAAAAGARAALDTPTRPDDISLFFNNAFESGCETPTANRAAGVGYSTSQLTPSGTYDLRVAVEEILRGCLDSSTPAKHSDASSTTPCESRQLEMQQQQQQQQQQQSSMESRTAPFSAYAAIEALLPPTSSAATAGPAELDVWAPELPTPGGLGCTPEQLTAPQGAFTESDEEEGLLVSPRSDRASGEAPAAGVRRDPMVYLGAGVARPAAGAVAGLLLDDTSTGNNGGGGAVATADSTSRHSSDTRSGAELYSSDDGHSGPDVFAMLAAAVQQQQQLQQQQQIPSAPFQPSGAAAGRQPIPVSQRSGYADGDVGHTSSCVTAGQTLPPPRRSYYLPQVKATAGSLIAVGGRRVPVDKLHLLSISDGPTPAPLAVPSPLCSKAPTTSAPSRRASASPSSAAQQSAPVPSRRRVPPAGVVTVTRAAAAAAAATVNVSVEEAASASSRGAPALVSRRDTPSSACHAALHGSCSYSNLPDAAAAAAAAPAREVVAGPSVRRVPPALAAQQRHCGSGGRSDGVQRSCEEDVVAVLQFSKGQTMCFLANLSTAALATARRAVARDRAGSKRSSPGAAAAASLLLAAPSMTAPTSVEVGQSYLAYVYADESPYDGAAVEDLGVCVQLVPPSAPSYAAQMNHVSGVLLRRVDVVANDEDRQHHDRALLRQTNAYIECERQFKFASLPFQLESIYFTFDGRVCVVLYRVLHPTHDGDSAAFSATPAHLHANTSRVTRELQFHLHCRVFLRQC